MAEITAAQKKLLLAILAQNKIKDPHAHEAADRAAETEAAELRRSRQ